VNAFLTAPSAISKTLAASFSDDYDKQKSNKISSFDTDIFLAYSFM